MNLIQEQKNKIGLQLNEGASSDAIPSFLLKTYEILENDKYHDIISWTKSGEGFIVKKVKEFAQNVLSIYFRHSNYTSFVRQLNMYDFHKTRQQNHQNAFKNIMFKRGFKHLLKDIQRKDYKKNKENPKQILNTNQKYSGAQKARDLKSDSHFDYASDAQKNNFQRMLQINFHLQKKCSELIQIREISSKQRNLLKIIDLLYDSKKIQKELLEKFEIFQRGIIEENQQKNRLKGRLFSTAKIDLKQDCLSTEAKITQFEIPKEDKEKINTFSTLFSSFRQN